MLNSGRRRICRAVFPAALLAVLPFAAQAQDAGALLRQQLERQEPAQLGRAVPEAAPERAIAVQPGGAGQTIVLKGLRFSGKADLLSEAAQTRIADSVTGLRLGIDGLFALADHITQELQTEGHMLARAILPPQDITEGFVTVEIKEGVLEAITILREPDVRADETMLQLIAESHIVAESVTRSGLEAALLRMDDHPGVTAQARLVPGLAPNTSRLVVNVEQAPVFSASAGADNAGSASTGRVQAHAGVVLTDITGHGDLTRFNLTASEGQRFGQVAFSMPVGPSGLMASANYAYLNYTNVDAAGRALGLRGHSHFAGLGLDYALMRSRDINLKLNAGLNWKALVDDSAAGLLQDKRLLTWTLGVSGEARDRVLGGGVSAGSLGWTIGDLDLSRVAAALAADQAGLRTQGQFHHLNASVTRVQELPGPFSLFGKFSGQWASKNLDSAAGFSLGGPNGVRGWPVGAGGGDMGAMATLELRYDAPIPLDLGNLQLATFLDVGHVWLNHSPNGVVPANACGCNDYSLTSLGVSANWARENLTLSATYALGLGSDPGRAIGAANGNHQFWLSGSVQF